MKVETPSDMYDSVLLRLRKWHNASLSQTEFEELINDAQMFYLNQRADEWEFNQKRIDDLGDLKKAAVLIPTNKPLNEFDFQNPAVIQGGGALTDLAPAVSGRYGYYRMGVVGIELDYKDNPCYPDGVPDSDSDEFVDWIWTKPMRSDHKLKSKENYYHKPQDDRIYYDIIGGNGVGKVMKVINGTRSRANRAYVEYLVHPRTIVINTPSVVTDVDLPMHARREVVEIAVMRYLERSESPRLKTQVAVNQLEKQ